MNISQYKIYRILMLLGKTAESNKIEILFYVEIETKFRNQNIKLILQKMRVSFLKILLRCIYSIVQHIKMCITHRRMSKIIMILNKILIVQQQIVFKYKNLKSKICKVSSKPPFIVYPHNKFNFIFLKKRKKDLQIKVCNII